MTQTAPIIERGFILAAGEGQRMRPLTETCPKPLLNVGGQPMIDYALDQLVAARVKQVVVNLNYLGEMLEDHLQSRQDIDITLSWEDERLETGGGVKKALDAFGNDPFYVLNGDVILTDTNHNNQTFLDHLHSSWNEEAMDLLLLLYPKDKLDDYAGQGDYHYDPTTHKISYRGDHEQADYLFAGPRIVHPRLFNDSPDGGFSFLELFHKAQREGRLFGAIHRGAWHHVGTPDALHLTDKILRQETAA